MDFFMGTRILRNRSRLLAGLILGSTVAFIAAVTNQPGTAAAESSNCNLTVPAKLAVDKSAVIFPVTKSCSGESPADLRWVATSDGTNSLYELIFLETDKAFGEAWADDPFGVWTWKPQAPAESPDLVMNEPTTDVRAKSTAVGTGVWDAAKGTTAVTFHVERYDPATNKMVPWTGVTGTLESHKSPLIGDPPFDRHGTYTTNSRGDVALTLSAATFDRVYRLAINDAPATFGVTSNNVLVRAAVIKPPPPTKVPTR
jgi:hypothetical protein